MSSTRCLFTKTNHREIEVRYAWNARQQRFDRGSPKLTTRLRMRDIERLFTHRYGTELPDDDAGLEDLELAAHHIAHLDGNAERHILDWAWMWAPWLWYRDDINPEEFAHRIATSPRRYKADTLAVKLRLTKDERDALGITTIRAIGWTTQMMADLRRKKKRWREAARRRATGAKSRLDSAAQTKPWEAMGMSRATWYRRGKPLAVSRPSVRQNRVRRIRVQQTEVDTMLDTNVSHRTASILGKLAYQWDEVPGKSLLNRHEPVNWIGRTGDLASLSLKSLSIGASERMRTAEGGNSQAVAA